MSVIVKGGAGGYTWEGGQHPRRFFGSSCRKKLAKGGWTVWGEHSRHEVLTCKCCPIPFPKAGFGLVERGRVRSEKEKWNSISSIRISLRTGPTSLLLVIIHPQIIKWYNFLETSLPTGLGEYSFVKIVSLFLYSELKTRALPWQHRIIPLLFKLTKRLRCCFLFIFYLKIVEKMPLLLPWEPSLCEEMVNFRQKWNTEYSWCLKEKFKFGFLFQVV